MTDNPTWVDLLAKSDAVVQASKDMTSKYDLCSSKKRQSSANRAYQYLLQ